MRAACNRARMHCMLRRRLGHRRGSTTRQLQGSASALRAGCARGRGTLGLGAGGVATRSDAGLARMPENAKYHSTFAIRADPPSGLFRSTMQVCDASCVFTGELCSRSCFILAGILVLVGGAIPPTLALPASTRTVARLKRVQGHSSPVSIAIRMGTRPPLKWRPRHSIRPHGLQRVC